MTSTGVLPRPLDVPPPGPPVPRGAGGDWVLLTVAAGQINAHLLRGRLAEEGIECFLDSFNAAPGAWVKPFGDPLAPVKVYVRRFDLDDAARLLNQIGQKARGPEAAMPHRESPRHVFAALFVVSVCGGLVFLEIFDFAPCALRLFCI